MVGKFIDEEYANRVSRAELLSLPPIERSSVKRSSNGVQAMTGLSRHGQCGVNRVLGLEEPQAKIMSVHRSSAGIA